MSNPRFPFPVPGPHNDTAAHPGDQKEPLNGMSQTHNGNQTKWADRPKSGESVTDLYQWSEEE